MAWRTILGLLAMLRRNLASFDQIVRIVKVLGLVNCTDKFTDHSAVINGSSNLRVHGFRHVGTRPGEQVSPVPLRGGHW